MFVSLPGRADRRARAAPHPARGFRRSWAERQSCARGGAPGGRAQMSEDWPTWRGLAEAFLARPLSSGFELSLAKGLASGCFLGLFAQRTSKRFLTCLPAPLAAGKPPSSSCSPEYAALPATCTSVSSPPSPSSLSPRARPDLDCCRRPFEYGDLKPFTQHSRGTFYFHYSNKHWNGTVSVRAVSPIDNFLKTWSRQGRVHQKISPVVAKEL